MPHEDIIARLTLEQKCALLSGATPFGTLAVPSAGVPAIEFSDGPHGLRHQTSQADNLGVGGSEPATCFPTAVTLADTWDEVLVSRVGKALGEEAVAQGVNVLLGPGVCIKRSPLCGRNFEYLSEDPYLAGKLGAAYVRGVQSQGVGACVKHFAANSQETRRQASDSVLDERTLREIYLTAFEIVVREAAPACVMSSYNLVNGTYANENAHLLRDILRDEWGFEGAVVSDWGGSNDHVAGVRAGSTLEMPGPGLGSARELLRAVRAGRLSEEDLDARVGEAVELALSTRGRRAGQERGFDVDAHHELAREVAAAGIVLLKNEAAAGAAAAGAGVAPAAGAGPAATVPGGAVGPGQRLDAAILPLRRGTRVGLVGDFARAPRYQGAGSSQVRCTRLDTLLESIRGTDDLELVGFEPGFGRDGAERPELAAAAVDLARRSDVVVCCLGLPEVAESEGADRLDLRLPEAQVALLRQVSRANPRVVVLLSAGSAVETGWDGDAAAVLYLGLGGQAGASAALDVLVGRQNPSGKLAQTWPARLEDTPCAEDFPAEGLVAAYREGLYVGYRYHETAGVRPAYPFGHGLSYTTFAYADLEVGPGASGVRLTITNTGALPGAEVAQLYISKPGATVFRPALELKGFAKVSLDPGESRRVTIPLDDKAFRYFNVRTGSWEVEGGAYVVSVGASCEDLRLSARVEVEGTGAPSPYEGVSLPSYESGQVGDVGDAEFEALLGHPLPSGKVALDRNLCLRDAGHSLSPGLRVAAALVGRRVERSAAEGRPDPSALFVYNMPLRAFAKNAGRYVGMGLVDALVREARGWGVAGVVPATVVALLVRRRLLSPVAFLATWLAWAAGPAGYEFVANQLRTRAYERCLERQAREG